MDWPTATVQIMCSGALAYYIGHLNRQSTVALEQMKVELGLHAEDYRHALQHKSKRYDLLREARIALMDAVKVSPHFPRPGADMDELAKYVQAARAYQESINRAYSIYRECLDEDLQAVVRQSHENQNPPSDRLERELEHFSLELWKPAEDLTVSAFHMLILDSVFVPYVLGTHIQKAFEIQLDRLIKPGA